MRPPRRLGLRRIAGSTSGSRRAAIRRFSQPHEQPQHDAAAEDQPDHRATGRATRARRAWAARSPTPPSAGCRSTIRPRPSAESAGADEVEPHPAPAGDVGHPAGQREDHDHDQDLAGEHPAPRAVGREQRRRSSGPAATAIAPPRRPARRRAAAPRGRSSRRRARRSRAGSAPRRGPRGTTSRSSAPSGSARARWSTTRSRRSTQPIVNARLRPMIWPILPPVIINDAITSV